MKNESEVNKFQNSSIKSFPQTNIKLNHQNTQQYNTKLICVVTKQNKNEKT